MTTTSWTSCTCFCSEHPPLPSHSSTFWLVQTIRYMTFKVPVCHLSPPTTPSKTSQPGFGHLGASFLSCLNSNPRRLVMPLEGLWEYHHHQQKKRNVRTPRHQSSWSWCPRKSSTSDATRNMQPNHEWLSTFTTVHQSETSHYRLQKHGFHSLGSSCFGRGAGTHTAPIMHRCLKLSETCLRAHLCNNCIWWKGFTHLQWEQEKKTLISSRFSCFRKANRDIKNHR